jgi:thymidine phosphorylase
LKAGCSGFIQRCDAKIIGEIVRDLGGGRLTKESVIRPEVGIDRIAKPGDPVQVGGVIARLHASSSADAEDGLMRLQAAFAIADEPPPALPIVREIFS